MDEAGAGAGTGTHVHRERWGSVKLLVWFPSSRLGLETVSVWSQTGWVSKNLCRCYLFEILRRGIDWIATGRGALPFLHRTLETVSVHSQTGFLSK